MKLRQVTMSVFILVLSLLALSCGQKGDKWQGTVEEVDGVTLVKNPLEPMYGEDVFIIEEELAIGESEGREEYMFSEIPSIAVDDENRIYAVDSKEAHIKVFDENGSYLRTIGRKGQGPGEIGRTNYVSITSQNELMLLDAGNRRITFFSQDGEFIKNISSAELFLLQTKIDTDGNIIGFHYVVGGENPRYELKKFDAELNHLFSVSSSPLPSASTDGFNPFFPVLRWDVINGNQIVCGYMKDYELTIYDAEGNLVKRITKEYLRVEVTQEDVDERLEGEELPPEMKDTMAIPKYHSPFNWIITDDEGRIFAKTYERMASQGGYYYDVFDAEGKCIASIPLKTRPFLLKGGKLYTIEEDSEGYQYIKRYKVTWNY